MTTQNDTARLLRECRAGIGMGISSLEDVLPYVKNKTLETYLKNAKEKHENLQREADELLSSADAEKKGPSSLAKSMSKMKTYTHLWWSRKDSTVASLMTDGCHMGVKSLCRYLCQYPTASEESRELARRLIALEDDMTVTLRNYLG